MRRIIISFVAMVLLLLFVSPAFGLTDSEIHMQVIEEYRAEYEKVTNAGKYSSKYLNQSIIDLVYVSQGTVTSYTYSGDNQQLDINTHTVTPQSKPSATNKITRFIFQVRNMYYPDNAVVLSVSQDRNTVHSRTYGPLKDEAMYAIISGLKECLDNEPVSSASRRSGSSSWVEQYSPENIEMVTTFKLNEPTYTITSSDTSELSVRAMDVRPIVRDGRTQVPVRYLAYALGATDNDIEWDSFSKTVALHIDETRETLTIGSTTLLVNDEAIEMDVAPFIYNDRTFLPARWIAEPLGAQVDWDDGKQEVVIVIEKEV